MKWADCTYCGERATSFDHVVPVCWYSRKGRRTSSELDKNKTVPCCHECNNLLGSYYLRTIAERAQHIADTLSRRNAKLLDSPVWGEWELENMEGFAKSYVIAKQVERRTVVNRIRHATTIVLYDLDIPTVWEAYEKGRLLLDFLWDAAQEEITM